MKTSYFPSGVAACRVNISVFAYANIRLEYRPFFTSVAVCIVCIAAFVFVHRKSIAVGYMYLKEKESGYHVFRLSSSSSIRSSDGSAIVARACVERPRL